MRAFDPVRTLLRVMLVVAVVVVAYFSVTTVPVYDNASIIQRVLVHAFTFFGLGVLAGYAFPNRYRDHPFRAAGSIIGLAVVLELVQIGSAVHSPALLDVGLDVVGAAVAVPVVRSLIGEEPGPELPDEVTEDQVQKRVTGNVQDTDITAIEPDMEDVQ